ncbi:MAG: HIT domain-containing protein [Candidatus Latescibacteria bacterium]|nr:HIT domain-containing protein [Candidatus Latescibacterota bacterium]
MNNNEKKGFEKLWAPWRMKYIECVDTEKTEGCIFCDKPQENKDAENYIVYRGKKCFIILNLYPYSNGHLMVVPYNHTANLNNLDSETRLEIMDLIDVVIRAMSNVMRPDGFNVGMNLGRTAGAGIDDHLHMHVVPRWNGDTNFMPVIGFAKVICESLEDTYTKLKRAVEDILKA